jgi:N-sulfoglucosamine sulfohydrolase
MRISMKFVLAVSSCLIACHSSLAAERPNILFCFADDWGRYASAYAKVDGKPSPNDVVQTPHIDRIAREGVLFRNAFVNAPSCTPCRSALLSGRYFFNTGRGAILSGAVWDSNIPSWPLLLKESGYHIGETWKVWSPGAPNDAPFGSGQFAYEKAGGQYNNFSENVTKMVREGTKLDDAKQKLFAEVTGNFDAFLAARPKDQPFCYWFGPTLVHRQWEAGSGKALWGIKPESLKGKLPKFLPDVPEVREDFADYLGEIQGFDAGIGLLLKRLEELGELDKTMVVISGDHGAPGFPGGKCNLYDFGLGVTLAVRWPGSSTKTETSEPVVSRVVDDLVNLMDLAPTFLEAGGVKAPPGMNGRSLVGILKSGMSGQVDPTRTWNISGRERHVGTAREENKPYPQRCLRTKDHLYIRNFAPDRWPLGSPLGVTADSAPDAAALSNNTYAAFPDMDASPTKAWLIAHRHDPEWKWHYDYAFAKRPAEELYDLRSDPEQTKNVASDPAYAATKAELSKRLIKTLTEVGDRRVTDDGQTFERSPFTDAVPQGNKKAKKAG